MEKQSSMPKSTLAKSLQIVFSMFLISNRNRKTWVSKRAPKKLSSLMKKNRKSSSAFDTPTCLRKLCYAWAPTLNSLLPKEWLFKVLPLNWAEQASSPKMRLRSLSSLAQLLVSVRWKSVTRYLLPLLCLNNLHSRNLSSQTRWT